MAHKVDSSSNWPLQWRTCYLGDDLFPSIHWNCSRNMLSPPSELWLSIPPRSTLPCEVTTYTTECQLSWIRAPVFLADSLVLLCLIETSYNQANRLHHLLCQSISFILLALICYMRVCCTSQIVFFFFSHPHPAPPIFVSPCLSFYWLSFAIWEFVAHRKLFSFFSPPKEIPFTGSHVCYMRVWCTSQIVFSPRSPFVSPCLRSSLVTTRTFQARKKENSLKIN